MAFQTSTVQRYNAADQPEDSTTQTVQITRDSDSAVILATTSVGIQHLGLGLYAYYYGALGLDPNLSYSITWTFVRAPFTDVVVDPINARDQTRTLRGLRRRLAGKLGRYQPLVVSSTDTSSDAARTLQFDELIDDGSSPSKYGGLYLYAATGPLVGQQRRIRNQGYTPQTGAVVVRRPYSSAPTAGSQFELLGRLPAFTTDGVQGLRECINDALRVTHHPTREEFDALSNQLNYPLSTRTWLRHEYQLGGEFDPNTDTTRNPDRSPSGARYRADADQPMLELDTSWTTGQTFQVEAARPNFNYIKANGAWGTSTVGLVDDDDETLGDDIMVVEVALAYAYRALMVAGSQADGASWESKWKAQEARAIEVRHERQDKLQATGVGATEHSPGQVTPVLFNRSRLRRW